MGVNIHKYQQMVVKSQKAQLRNNALLLLL